MSAKERAEVAARIAELRKRITANKGVAKRARWTARMLGVKAEDAETAITRDQREIERMGGRVRR